MKVKINYKNSLGKDVAHYICGSDPSLKFLNIIL